MSQPTGIHTISALDGRRELAALLGDLTVAWSHAERVMYFAFWVASGTRQEKAFDIYESMSGPKARLDLTLSLFEQDRPDHPNFDKIVEKLRAIVACSSLRNEVVHRTWAADDQNNLYLLSHRMTKRVPELKRVDENQIRTLVKTINSSCDGLLELIQQTFPEAFKPVPPS
jgi:hypothetical protein